MRRLLAPLMPVRDTIPPEVLLDIAGAPVTVAIKRRADARRLSLKVRNASGSVSLTIPPRVAWRTAAAFLDDHRGWIAARLAALPRSVPFVDGSIIPLRGVDHRLTHRPGARGTVWLELDETGLLLCVAGDAPHLSRRVTAYLKRQARLDIDAAVARHAVALGVSIKRIAIKDTRSRWGSCAADGTLSFSWRMILAPPYVLDYLAAHEVCHRKEMNHSARYWALVRSLVDDIETPERWLKRHGARLHAYGRNDAVPV